MKENKNITYPNLWHEAKAVIRVKFITLNAYMEKEERSQVNNLASHFRKLKEKSKPKAGRKKEIIKIRGEIIKK